eukprot:COSAG01_NODE_4434_length_5028_cov_36.097180_4_plen_134_part_00
MPNDQPDEESHHPPAANVAVLRARVVSAPPLDNVGGACGLAQQLRVHLDGKAVFRPPFGKKAVEGGETPNLAAQQHLEAQAQQLAVAVSTLATEAATMAVAAVAAAGERASSSGPTAALPRQHKAGRCHGTPA